MSIIQPTTRTKCNTPIVGSAMRATLTSMSDMAAELGVGFIGEGVVIVNLHEGGTDTTQEGCLPHRGRRRRQLE